MDNTRRMNQAELRAVFELAKKENLGIVVSVHNDDMRGEEMIFNTFENLDYKLDYYLRAYDDSLVLKNNPRIRITDISTVDFRMK